MENLGDGPLIPVDCMLNMHGADVDYEHACHYDKRLIQHKSQERIIKGFMQCS